ncbi:MAG TPA: PQQ-binding-like beta-propeller repeat protein, partial [Roseiflexaceae bacterium]
MGGRLFGMIAGLFNGSNSSVDGPGGLLGGASELPAVLAQLKLGSISGIAAVLPRDGKGGDLVVYTRSMKDDSYSVALIDGDTRAPRWQSQPLSKNAYQGALVAGQDAVYLTDQNKLVALRLRDGTQAWQAGLDVEPQSFCDECLRLVGGHVVVLEKNGGLQSFDGQTGKLAWSARLSDRPRRLPVAGGRLLTVQPTQDQQGVVVSLLDPATGKAALQIFPHCPKPNDFSKLERPEADTPFLFSPDGKTMYTMYGFFSKCAQAFDLASGKVRWEEMLDEQLRLPAWDNDGGQVIAEQNIFTSRDSTIWALDTADGKIRALAEDKEYNLRPLALSGGTLIVLASPTWDSERQAIWGIDAASGERRWQAPLQAHELRRGTSSGDWDWRLSSRGLVVAQVLRDEAHLIVETLDPRTGARSARQETALADLHSPSLRDARWTDDMAW